MNADAAQRRPEHEPLIGLATLMSLAHAGGDLAPLGARMIARAQEAADDANALMDLSTILQLKGRPDIGLAAQAQALQLQQLYRHRAAAPALRLLAFMAPGDLMANAPLEFLLQGSDVTLDMLYIVPGMPFPPPMPEHDLAYVAVSESDRNRPLLQQLDRLLQAWPRPVCNAPGRIGRTAREVAHALLAPVAAICMPISARIDRDALERLGQGELELGTVLADGDFPLIVRPVDSHAGKGLAKIDAPGAICDYLRALPQREFIISRYVDYRGADGLYRKFRVALIGGRPFACHMGISDHWMIHYLNAGMNESAQKRAEEERFMADFDRGFGLRHGAAFAAIDARIGLDYLVLDCAETADGKLLLFELDPAAVVHAMDPVEVFPYKRAQMRKVFKAFRDLLSGAIDSASAARARCAAPPRKRS